MIQRHFKILSSSTRCNSVFQTTPLVAFRRTDNLNDILVRSKLGADKQTNVTKGSFRCGKNCITCRYITDGRTNYTFSATGETRTIYDRIDCNSKNLIYMIHCLRCNKQYIGETKRRLKDRFNEHRRPVDRPTPSSRPTAVSEHFLSDNHSRHRTGTTRTHSSKFRFLKLLHLLIRSYLVPVLLICPLALSHFLKFNVFGCRTQSNTVKWIEYD